MPPNREQTWYCHECRSETQPTMIQDPHCISCNGTFVEMIESPQDDPRAWENMEQGDNGDLDDLTAQLRDVFPGGPRPGSGFTFSIDRSSSPGRGTRTVIFGGPGRGDMGPDRVMPLTEFLAETTGDGSGRPMRDGLGPGGIPQHLVMNQIFGALAQRHADRRGTAAANPLAEILGVHRGLEEGRLGDYVLNQQALDQIMTALIENSNAHRPVPATEQVVDRLDHQVLEEGSPLLEQACAICKDQFSLKTEDPDEQVIVTLPCKHPFHSPCILPWLKQSGTCPICRHQLVPQPGSTPNPNDVTGNARPEPSGGTSRPLPPTNPFAQPRTDSPPLNWPEPSRDRGRAESQERSQGGSGIFGMVGSLFHSLGGASQNPAPVPSTSDSRPPTFPGSWEPTPSSRPESGSRSSRMRGQISRPADGTTSNSRQRHSQTPLNDRSGLTYGSSHNTNSDNHDSHGSSTNERTWYNTGRDRRGSYDRERRGDRNGQRRNTRSWDHPELD